MCSGLAGGHRSIWTRQDLAMGNDLELQESKNHGSTTKTRAKRSRDNCEICEMVKRSEAYYGILTFLLRDI